MPLVLEAHGDPVVAEDPKLLAQHVVELTLPLATEERTDGAAAVEELVAVTPDGALAVRKRYAVGVSGVPRVLGSLHLDARARLVERR